MEWLVLLVIAGIVGGIAYEASRPSIAVPDPHGYLELVGGLLTVSALGQTALTIDITNNFLNFRVAQPSTMPGQFFVARNGNGPTVSQLLATATGLIPWVSTDVFAAVTSTASPAVMLQFEQPGVLPSVAQGTAAMDTTTDIEVAAQGRSLAMLGMATGPIANPAPNFTV